MKEGKTKTTTKKKTNNKRPSNTKNTNKVKDVEFTPVEENFLDENEEDKRLVVFIAIAILIIVGTVIGLLVGCQKEENKEPDKPADEDIVIPSDPVEEDKDNKEAYNYEKPLPVVRKVTKKTTKKNTNNTTTEEDETGYDVTFYLNDNSEKVRVESGSEAEKYVPDGYSECSYYTDEDLTTEYTFGEVTSSINVYMSCSLVTYTINYDVQTDNPSTYTVEDNDVALNDAETDTGLFEGWYTESEGGTKITSLTKDIISYANENNVINLYARFTSNDVVVDPTGNSPEDTVEPTEEGTVDGLAFNEKDDSFVSEDNNENNLEVDEREKEETEENEIVLSEETVNEELTNEEEKNTEESDFVEPTDEPKEEITQPVDSDIPVTTEPTTPTIEPSDPEEKTEEVVSKKEEKKENTVTETKEEKKEEPKVEVKEEPEEEVPANEE